MQSHSSHLPIIVAKALRKYITRGMIVEFCLRTSSETERRSMPTSNVWTGYYGSLCLRAYVGVDTYVRWCGLSQPLM